MKLIINADDFGLTKGVCDSIIMLLEKRAISNTTAMICVDGAYDRCVELRYNGLSKYVGVHLQTTPEKHHRVPLSPIEDIPTLVDKDGFFKDKDHKDWINPEEVELEWERQIVKTVDALGHKPSHLDSHHGRHRIPELQSTYLKLANKYDIPVRGGRELKQIDGSKLGVKSSDIASSDWTGKDNNLDYLKRFIKENIMKDGVLEIVAHPGFYDEELLKSSSWNKVRENDHNVLIQLKEEKWLENNGVELVRYPLIN